MAKQWDYWGRASIISVSGTSIDEQHSLAAPDPMGLRTKERIRLG